MIRLLTINAFALVWRPALAPSWIVALAAALGLLTVWTYRRGLRTSPTAGALLLAMRLVIVVALALILMGPSVVPAAATDPTRARLTILLDTSASMLTPDADGGKSRIESVTQKWLDPAQLRAMRETFDLRLVGFDESSRTLGAAALEKDPRALAAGRSSHYLDALTASLLEISPDENSGASLVVIGDGHDTDDASLEPAVTLANNRHVPIHTISVGAATSVRDVSLVAVPTQDFLMSKETGHIAVRLNQSGFDDSSVTVHVRHGNETIDRKLSFGGKPWASTDVPITAGDAGPTEYEVWADPLPGEAVLTNNKQSVFIDVADHPIRVLILEGEPNWDTKFIAQSLRGERRAQVTSIVQVNASKQEHIATRKENAEPITPRSAEAMAKYDVIVIGRGIENLMDPAAMGALVRYVSEGGGHVVFARGRPYDPQTPAGQAAAAALVPLEPVAWAAGPDDDSDSAPLNPTASGDATPLFTFSGVVTDPRQAIAALPGLLSATPVRNVKPATLVLATIGAAGSAAQGRRPAIVSMHDGRGSVLAILGEGLWQWSLLPPELKQYRGVYASFWSSAVRWLALGGEFQPGQQVSLKLSRSSVRLGDPLVLDVATKSNPAGFSPTLRLFDPDGREQRIGLDAAAGSELRREATVMPDKAGVWRAVLEASPLTPTTQERRFSVYDADVERLRTEARPDVMRAVAEQTGGLHFNADEPTDLTRELQRRQAAMRVSPRPVYAWDTATIMALLLAWVGLEWIGRRRAGWL